MSVQESHSHDHRSAPTHSRLAIAMVTACLAFAPLGAGCTGDAGPGEQPATAQLVFPLIQFGSQGELYHLANATFDIVSQNDGSTFTIDGSGSETELSLDIPPGIFDITLRDGWVLERSQNGGASFQPVPALLGTPNPNVARALASQPIILQYDFLIRSVDATLQVRLGVVSEPRELAGGLVIATATDGLADYATLNRLLDFAVYFQAAAIETAILEDGTRQRTYTAGPIGVAGPFPQLASPVAAEFYGDHLGRLSGPITQELVGAFLEYIVAARPDGTIELSGTLQGGSTLIEFGPAAIDPLSAPSLDADGFPVDEFFYASTLPFTFEHFLGTMSGVLRMRHLVP